MNFCKIFKPICAALLLVLLLAEPCPAFDTALDDELLILVNSSHRISAAYKPEDLQNTSRKAPSTKSRLLLREPAAEAYIKMIADYRADNKRPIYSISGYRDFAYQRKLFTGKVAGRQAQGQTYAAAYANTLLYTALPGTSEHQTGLAVDLSANSGLSDNFRDTAQGQWLLENCWDYGFILRYDEDKIDLTEIAYEPWHYRYVGLPHSLIIRDNDWVLEEYIAYLQAEGELAYIDEANPDTLWRVYWTDNPAEEFANLQSVSRDNAGGYIITTQNSLLEELLTAWAQKILYEDALAL